MGLSPTRTAQDREDACLLLAGLGPARRAVADDRYQRSPSDSVRTKSSGRIAVKAAKWAGAATHRAVAIDHRTQRSTHFVSDGAAGAATGLPGLR
jgi:hypothetical protein